MLKLQRSDALRFPYTCPIPALEEKTYWWTLGLSLYGWKSHHPVLVVPIPNANARTLPQGVPGVERAAEDLMGGGREVNREMEESLEGPGSAGR
jgi:hypothetical protein